VVAHSACQGAIRNFSNPHASAVQFFQDSPQDFVDALHSKSLNLCPQHGAQSMDNGSKHATRRCVGVSAPLTATVIDFISREYGRRPHAAKLLAKLARTSHRTAERWVTGAAAPSGDNLMHLLVECEGLADELNRAVAEQRKQKT
jgi:hypothetical protein